MFCEIFWLSRVLTQCAGHANFCMSAIAQSALWDPFHNAQEIMMPPPLHVLFEDRSRYYRDDAIYRPMWAKWQRQRFVLDGHGAYLVDFKIFTKCNHSPITSKDAHGACGAQVFPDLSHFSSLATHSTDTIWAVSIRMERRH